MKKFLIAILSTSTVTLTYAENSSHSTTSRDNNVGISKQNKDVANSISENHLHMNIGISKENKGTDKVGSNKNEPAPSKNKVKQLIIPNLVGTSK